ncbi:MAG: hypothetical protein AAGB04_27485 [Pseudomonadota bacterium]
MDNSGELKSNQSPLTAGEQVDLLLRLYVEEKTYARAHENTRSVVTNIIAAAAALLVGFVTFDDAVDFNDIPMSVFLIIIGIFGAIISLKQYERTRLHLYRAEYILKQIQSVSSMDLVAAKSYSYDSNEKRFGWLYRRKLNFLWTVLHLFISTIGAAILVQIILSTAS